MKKSVIKVLSALAVVAAANPAAAVVLDITNAGPGNNFGDTSTVNFTWDPDIRYATAYSGEDAFYCDPRKLDGGCLFSIAPTGSATSVILNSFKFGLYQTNPSGSVLWSVTDISSSAVVASSTATLTNQTFAIVDINLTSGLLGFQVSFGPESHFAGLNSVTYNEALVPTPASLALLGSALFGFAATRRKKA